MADPRHDKNGKFAVGHAGGPGRPKGSRNKLTEEFLTAMAEDFMVHGKVAIATARADKPTEYLKIIAHIIPSHAEIKINDYEELSDDRLRQALTAAIIDLEAFGIGLGFEDGERDGSESQREQPPTVSTIQ